MYSSELKKVFEKVLFIGGNPALASTRMRTTQMAKFLGCDYSLNSYVDEKILQNKSIFILNKAFDVDRQMLKQRGSVIVDIIDPVGIPDDVHGYLVSSNFAKKILNLPKPTFVIYQHHLNFSNLPNSTIQNPKRVSFIGERHWYPENLLPPHVAYLDMNGDDKERQEKITDAYRNTDILLNFRNPRIEQEYTKRHLILNGGMKIINAMAFGIPSISAPEPVFQEIGQGCTIFSSFENCARDLEKLTQDENLYNEIRANCIKRADEFSIENLSKKFIEAILFFNELKN